VRKEKLPKALCPKCGQFGFVCKRWVDSSYYPMLDSIPIMMIENREAELAKDPNNIALKASLETFKRKVVGKVFRGEPRKHLSGYNDSENIQDKKSLYRVTYGRYAYFYIGHYNKEKYKQEMIKYREGKIKSRPNGRKWCKLPKYFHQYYIANGHDGKYIRFVKSDYPLRGEKIL
jgi:hypothetical protein